MFSFFTGRSNRQEYWISVGILVVVAFALSYFQMQAASAAITVMWIITWMRRLHDVNRSGLWSAVPVVVGVALVTIGLAVGGKPFIQALEQMQAAGTPPNISDRTLMVFVAVVIAALVVQFGFTIWLGAKEGDKGSNKFGAPPEDLFKRS
jgi:uncharacterized membrane protein YhaH (DUF805 family)